MALGLREGSGAAEEVRGSSCYASSDSFAYDGTPPPAQQMMDRHPPVVLGADHDDGRIPASVFERDASDPSKDWSMMSTESVFGIQVAPSCDFTGYFLSHPELMDIATPPRDSSFGVGVATPHAAASPSRPFQSIPELTESVFGIQVAPSCDFTGYFLSHPELMDIATPPRDSSFGVGVATPHAAASPSRPFQSIPELGNAAPSYSPSYSFAFPKLMEDSSKRNQSREQPLTPKASARSPTTETAPPEAEAKSKPEAPPAQEAPKGGMFSWMPCCS